jgi:hypothetical protein
MAITWQILPNINEYKHLLGKVTDVTLANKYGVTRERIRQIRIFHKIPSFIIGRYTYNSINKNLIVQLGKVPDNKLSDEFDISPDLVKEKRESLNIGKFLNVGELNGRTLLTKNEVITIKEKLKKYKRGMYTALAKEYDVHYNRIRDIHNGRTWKHLINSDSISK